MRLLLVTLVLALTGTLAVDLQPGSAPRAARPVALGAVKTVVRPETVEVALLRNGRIARVERVVPKGIDPARHALRELLRGPTREERVQGFRTAFAQGAVRLRFVVREGDLWRVRFSRGLLGPAARRTVQTRLAQIGRASCRERVFVGV